MYLGFRPLPSELPFLHKRSAPRFVLVRLKQESRVSKIIDIISPPSSRLKRFWSTDEMQTQRITRSLDKTKICPVTTPFFYKDRSYFRKFQWDLQYFPCDLRYVTESSLFIWRLGSRVEGSVHAWRGSTVILFALSKKAVLISFKWNCHLNWLCYIRHYIIDCHFNFISVLNINGSRHMWYVA